jgi:hypothetical protein
MSGRDADAAAADPVAWVERLRAQGAAVADPVRFGIAEALARRAAAQQGGARLVLLQRLETLLAAQAARRPPCTDKAEPHLPALAGLTALVDRLGRVPVASAPARPADAPAAVPLSRIAPPRKLKAVNAFQGTWSRLRVEQRLRQALAQVPASAGPLNSSNLVNRALQAMQDISPEYLDAFMSHIDTLQWIEQTVDAGEAAVRAAAPPAEGRRRPAGRAVRKS